MPKVPISQLVSQQVYSMNQVFTNQFTLYSFVREQVGEVMMLHIRKDLVGVEGKDMVEGLNII